MRLVLILLLLCSLTACSPTVQDNNGAKTEGVKADNVLVRSQTTHTFSDTAAADTFRITLRGDSILTSKVTLEIISSQGEMLYKNDFDANFLLDYNLKPNATIKEREDFILDRVEHFFDPENFMEPAIRKDQQFDPNYSNRAAWDEIKADTNAIGFHYQLGKEDGRWLAYSKKQNKVILYFNCC